MEDEMNKKEANKYSMYRSVCEVLKNNEKLFTDIPAMTTAADSFKNYFSEIAKIDDRFMSVAKGTTKEKIITHEKLESSVIKISGLLFVTGKKINNENLKELTNITHSDIKIMRADVFIQKSKNILNNAKAFLSTLKTMDNNIDAEISDLEENINHYENAVNMKESKSAESHSTKNSLEKSFKTADEILKDEIDRYIELVKEKYPDFYDQYIKARTIKDLGIKRTKKTEPEKQ
jgi:hypothetical protein